MGMEFRDVGCVRMPFAMNSDHFQPILIENLSNPIGINPKSIYWRSAAEAEPINLKLCFFDFISVEQAIDKVSLNRQMTRYH